MVGVLMQCLVHKGGGHTRMLFSKTHSNGSMQSHGCVDPCLVRTSSVRLTTSIGLLQPCKYDLFVASITVQEGAIQGFPAVHWNNTSMLAFQLSTKLYITGAQSCPN